METSFERSPPVTTTGIRLMVLALKLVHELLVISVPLGSTVRALHELNITGVSRVTLVVFVIPEPVTILTHERVDHDMLIGDI